MSGEKIDLVQLERELLVASKGAYFETEDVSELLALVRVARAAMTYARSGHVADRLALDAALAPFADSAEVRSDGC